MYRLLIVDDERIIADLLAEMFSHRDDFDLDIYKAYSGREAMEILKRQRIDIILTDVTMPGMSGIELQAEATALWPKCQVIFLTAYNHFDNLRAAMRNKAVDFILKSEKDDMLIESVRRATAALEHESRADAHLSRARASLEAALPLLQQMFLQDVFGGEIEAAQMEAAFEEYDLELSARDGVLLLVGRTDIWEAKKLRKYVYAVNRLTKELLSGQCRAFTFACDEQYLIFLLQPLPGGTERDIIRLAEGNIEAIQDICRSAGGFSVSMILADGVCSWADAPKKFGALTQKLDGVFGLSAEIAILEGAEQEEPDTASAAGDIKREMSGMRLYLESAQEESFWACFSSFASALLSGMPKRHVQEALLEMNLMFFSLINGRTGAEEFGQYAQTEKLLRVEEDEDLPERLKSYQEMAKFIFMKRNMGHLAAMNKVFGELRRYIHENLAGDLSLYRLSQIVHFNPSYLSRLFKSVIEKSLSEYISDVKLKRACELLRDTDMLIADVAQAVGYENQQNFTRFFRRHMNMTPNQFRER